METMDFLIDVYSELHNIQDMDHFTEISDREMAFYTKLSWFERTIYKCAYIELILIICDDCLAGYMHRVLTAALKDIRSTLYAEDHAEVDDEAAVRIIKEKILEFYDGFDEIDMHMLDIVHMTKL